MSDTANISEGNWIDQYILPQAIMAKREIEKIVAACHECHSFITILLDCHRWCFEVDRYGGVDCECPPEIHDTLDFTRKGGYYEGMVRCSRQESEERRAREPKTEDDYAAAFERFVDRRIDCRTGKSKDELPRINQRTHANGAREAYVRRLNSPER